VLGPNICLANSYYRNLRDSADADATLIGKTDTSADADSITPTAICWQGH
jgi:hypothetical protein